MNHSKKEHVIQRLFLSLFPIQALSVGLPAINTLINGLIIGKFLGENELAAIGFASPLILCITALSGFLSLGSQVYSSRCLGKGNQSEINGTFVVTIITCLAVGISFSLLMLLFPSGISVLLGASGETALLTAGYIRGIAIGTAASILSASLIVFLQMECMKPIAVICTIISLAINAGGNIINALVLKWGVFGVGFFMSMGSIV